MADELVLRDKTVFPPDKLSIRNAKHVYSLPVVMSLLPSRVCPPVAAGKLNAKTNEGFNLTKINNIHNYSYWKLPSNTKKKRSKYGTVRHSFLPALSLADGLDFQNTPCPAVLYFFYFELICAQSPIHRVLLCSCHQEVDK